MNKQDIIKLPAEDEHIILECQQIQNTVPVSFWNTYSAFASTISRFSLLIFVLLVYSCSASKSNWGVKNENYDKILVINELMAANRTGLLAENGKPEDWIEIKNISSDTIDLEGYSIEIIPAIKDSLLVHGEESPKADDTTNSPDKDGTKNFIWHFPSVKIAGGDCLLVFATKSKKPFRNSKELMADLKLPKNGGIARLSAPDGSIMSEVEWEELNPDHSLQRQENCIYVQTYWQSPGFDNTPEGFEKSCVRIDSQRHSPILIWELMSRAKKPNNNWIELKNVSDSAIDLSSYRLSRKIGKGKEWALPKRMLQPGQIICIQFAGKKANKWDALQANFKLDETETVVLTKEGKFIDGVCAKPTIYGTSIGRVNGRKGFFFYSSPSRNGDNGTNGRRYITEMPQFDCTPGIYKKEKRLCLHLNAKGHPIHYTLDGSEPTSSSPIYKDSIVITQSTVVRAYAKGDSTSLHSDIATATYLLETEHEMAVINIAINENDLYDFYNGIYADGPGYSPNWPHLGANFWKNWIKKAHVEFFDGKKGFSQDCGLKIFGGFSRYEAKKSFCLKFNEEYGCPTVSYDFFGNGETLELQDLVLRSGSQDYNRCMLRDEFFTSLLKTQSPTLITQIYRPIALYINAKYFGLYYIREKIDKHFVARQLNVPSDSINIIASIDVNEEGSSIPYKRLIQYVSNHNMADSACYNHVLQMVDLQGLIDHKIGEIYAGNTDVGNVRYVRSTDSQSDGKWHFVFYDLDATWLESRPIEFYLSTGERATAANVVAYNILISNLLANKDFRRLFLKRLSYHMHHTFSTENATAVFDEIVKQIRPEMKRNCERWPQLSYENWEKNIADFRKKFDTKPKAMLDNLRKYLSITKEEENMYFSDLGF